MYITMCKRDSWWQAAIPHRELSSALFDDLKGWDKGERVGWRFKKERIYVYLGLIHTVVWQKPVQHCKAIILP